MAESSPESGRLTPWRRRVLDRIFDQLLDLDEQDRASRLQQMAATHPRTARHLATLIAATAQSTDGIEAIIGQLAGSMVGSVGDPDPALPTGTRLGAWRLIQLIGTGGMGTVYRAERADGAFEMEAAVKLIRTRNDPQLAARLAVERQLLARLDHPNIARILDGGTTEEGQSYLVMEWVPGEDLHRCGNRRRENHEQCLDRFFKIAEAVKHAHQRRVIHGDIKPANVRIGTDGRVRLLDFGVARLIAEEQGKTGDRIRALTPAFSAPELLRGEPASTQSDVWALGALFFWMLTGQSMTTRLAGSVSSIRSSLPRHLPRPGDLAAIIAMACTGDPDERYAGISALIKDLERYRELQPIAARAATRRYLASRFVRRNPVAVSLGTACAGLLVIGLTATAWQAHLAGLERDRAEQQRDLAQLETAKTERVSEFLVELFELADPHQTLGRELSARELIEQGSKRIEQLQEAPKVQAAMFQVLARVNRSLAEHEAAHDMASRALEILQAQPGVSRQELANAWAQVGATLSSLGRYAEAEDAHRRALALTDSDDRLAVATALNNLGLSLYSLGRFDQAEYMLREAMDIRQAEMPGSAELAASYNNMALLLSATDRSDQAEPLYRMALQIRREELGEAHPATTYSMTNLATLLAQTGRWDAAEPLYLEALDRRQRLFGRTHPAVASVLYQLGWLNSQRDNPDLARAYYEQALELRRELLGDDHPSVGVILNALARTARDQGELGDAERYLEQALKTFRRTYGDSHHDIALVLANLGATRMKQRDYPAARELLFQALEMNRRELGDHHRHVGDNLASLAELHLLMDETDQALAHAMQAQAVYQGLGVEHDHPSLASSRALIDRIQAQDAGH